jgi:hypothetical protein
LLHCEQEFVPLQPLLTHVPRGTLYRHVATLQALGLVAKRGRTYGTTEQGRQRLAELASTMDWNLWDGIYPPIQSVPTPQHRAVVELVAASAAVRQADCQDDHHPGVMLMGPTLAWKTSTATFLCHLFGLLPAQIIIDLTTESARSLLARRDGKGHLIFTRDLLSGPLVVFDDYLEADAAVRPAVHHFLSGRTVVPIDNAILRIAPVSVLTLNPRAKATLEEQTTFSTAQLRRLVVTNLANVVCPDLATMGHQALEAAARHGALPLPLPTVDARTWRPAIVELLREILVPEVLSRVDTEMILVMATGMSGFIREPERAIQQTVYDYAVTAETLGWTRPGWVERVSQFSLHAPPPTRSRRDAVRQEASATEELLIIRRHLMESYNESALPAFVISDTNKARILAIASQENIPLEHADHALGVVLDNWLQQQRNGRELDDVHSVLQVCKELDERGIPVRDIKLAAKLHKVFREGHHTPEEFEEALNLLPTLHTHGLTSQDDRTETALGLAARLLHSPRSLTEIEAWLNKTAGSAKGPEA